jgi:hypothetical protein
MTPSHCRKTGTKYRYYNSAALAQGQPKGAGSISRVPPQDRGRGLFRYGHLLEKLADYTGRR